MYFFVSYTIFKDSYIPPSLLPHHVKNSIEQVTQIYGVSPIGVALSPLEYQIATLREDNWHQGLEVLTFPEIKIGQIFIRKRPLNFDVFKIKPKYLTYDYLDSVLYHLGDPPFALISRFYRGACRVTRIRCSPYPLLNEIWRPKNE